MCEAFDRGRRLLRAREYAAVFARGCRSRDRLLTVVAAGNDGAVARLGLAIGTRHVRLATRRNRIKRVVRESFRRHQRQLRGLDVVVLGRPGLDAVDTRVLSASLERHWQQLNERCRDS